MITALFIGAVNAQTKNSSKDNLLVETNDSAPIGSFDLTGTWTVVITPDDGSPSFVGYYSFNSDGNASFSSAGLPIPGLGNSGYGVWEKTGRNRFAATIRMNSYTENFQFDGTVKINSKIQMTSRNTFITQDTVKVFDADGNEIVTLGGSAHGTRMVVED